MNKTRVTCATCRWCVVDKRQNVFCHRHAPIASQDDGDAWFPILEPADVEVGCGDHEPVSIMDKELSPK